MTVHFWLDGVALDQKVTALAGIRAQTAATIHAIGPERYAAVVVRKRYRRHPCRVRSSPGK